MDHKQNGLEEGIYGAIHSAHKKINITNALSFPKPYADTSITTTENEIIPTITHHADNGPIGVI